MTSSSNAVFFVIVIVYLWLCSSAILESGGNVWGCDVSVLFSQCAYSIPNFRRFHKNGAPNGLIVYNPPSNCNRDLFANKVKFCDGFKVGCDWSRVTFSPDGQYLAVGSADGSVYIWGVNSAKVEGILKDHSSAVTATGWHPYGSMLASVDRTKKAVIWSDM